MRTNPPGMPAASKPYSFHLPSSFSLSFSLTLLLLLLLLSSFFLSFFLSFFSGCPFPLHNFILVSPAFPSAIPTFSFHWEASPQNLKRLLEEGTDEELLASSSSSSSSSLPRKRSSSSGPSPSFKKKIKMFSGTSALTSCDPSPSSSVKGKEREQDLQMGECKESHPKVSLHFLSLSTHLSPLMLCSSRRTLIGLTLGDPLFSNHPK